MGFVVLALVIVTGIGLTMALAITSSHRARSAADLAALAGAAAYAEDADACSAARETASSNGGTVTACELHGDPVSFVIVVHVRVAGIDGVFRSLAEFTAKAEAGHLEPGA
jgi:secretion/DNA translocation related TadE-like protein